MKPAKAISSRSLVADATSIKAKTKRRKRTKQADKAGKKLGRKETSEEMETRHREKRKNLYPNMESTKAD